MGKRTREIHKRSLKRITLRGTALLMAAVALSFCVKVERVEAVVPAVVAGAISGEMLIKIILAAGGIYLAGDTVEMLMNESEPPVFEHGAVIDGTHYSAEAIAAMDVNMQDAQAWEAFKIQVGEKVMQAPIQVLETGKAVMALTTGQLSTIWDSLSVGLNGLTSNVLGTLDGNLIHRVAGNVKEIIMNGGVANKDFDLTAKMAGITPFDRETPVGTVVNQLSINGIDYKFEYNGYSGANHCSTFTSKALGISDKSPIFSIDVPQMHLTAVDGYLKIAVVSHKYVLGGNGPYPIKERTVVYSTTVGTIDQANIRPLYSSTTPDNILSNPAAALGKAIQLAGVTADNQLIGIKLPTSPGDVVGTTPQEIVVPMPGGIAINPPGEIVVNPPIDIPVAPPMTGDIATDLGNIAAMLNALATELARVKANVIALPGTIADSIAGTLAGIQDAVTAINAKVDGELAGLKETVIALPDTIADVVDGKLTDVQDGVTALDEKVTAMQDTLSSSIGATIVGTGELDFSSLEKKTDLTTLFPFCIPFDFIRAVKSLQAPPQPPKYVFDMSGTILATRWELDFAEFESLAQVTRWGVWISFFIGLMLVTSRFIKW